MAFAAPPLQVLYIADGYISHATAAGSYRRALAALGSLTDDPERADVVVLHSEMRRLGALRASLPALANKYIVAMLVWETDRLHPDDMPAVRAVDEIWTPSLFSAQALVQVHRRVFLLPHVVESPAAVPGSARALVDTWLGPDTGTFDVLAIMPMSEIRKNAAALMRAARNLRQRIPALRLILKTPFNALNQPTPLDVKRGMGRLLLRGQVPRDALRALIVRVHCVASAHRAEAWGLTLSDALAHGTPVVATGFSGNMAFMSKENSLLVDYRPTRLGALAGNSPFSPDARWADPVQSSLEAQLVCAYESHCRGGDSARRRQGQRDMKRYSAKRLQILMAGRLQALAQGPNKPLRCAPPVVPQR